MSIQTAEARKLLAKFGCLPRQPNTAEGITVIAETLADSSRNMWHAGAIVDRIAKTAEHWPTPFVVSQTAAEILREYEPEKPVNYRAQCRHCSGRGLRSDDYLLTQPTKGGHGTSTRERLEPGRSLALSLQGLPPNQRILSAATICDCAAGDEYRIARLKAEQAGEKIMRIS